MIGARGMKVFRDLTVRPGRSLLAVLAMAAGILEISAMLYKYALLQPELRSMYGKTHPSSATIITDDASDALLAAVRRVPGVGVAEARPVIMARARIGEDDWVPAILYVVRDFDHQQLDTFKPDRGQWPPKAGEILLERTALSVAKIAIGSPLTIRLPGGDDLALPVTGTVYAAGLAPAWMEHMVPGFVAWDSPVRGESHDESAQIRFTVADHPLDEGHIREVADSVRSMLEREGHLVSRVTVPPPGRHPHADQMEAFLFLLLAFGILSFALSTVLVASMTHELMAEQVKQVGIMKAIGGTHRQIASMYVAQVGVLAAAALAIGIPLGLVVGGAYARFAAGILNADLTNRPFPFVLILFEIVLGLAIPMLVALGPVRRAARISVREALGDEPGASVPSKTPGTRVAWPWLPRPLALSLRATFQRRGRLALTVGMLAVGGAAFMSALNVAAAWTRGVDKDFAGRHFNLTASFSEPQPIETVERVLAAVPEVARAEYWPSASPYLLNADGVPGATVGMVGLTPGSSLLQLPMLAGRWLAPGDSLGAVVNRAVLTRNPALAIGREVSVRLNGRTTSLPIIGIAREMAPMPMIYTTSSTVLAATGRPADLTRIARIVTRRTDPEGEKAAAAAVERAFAKAEIEVLAMQRMQDMKKGILDHLVIIFSILTVASVIVVFVGGLALASNLMLSVIQRTREIGVLGAIGATPRTIASHVWFEAVAIGLLGWIAGVALAVPLSWALESATGNIFFKSPLEFYLSPLAALAWLGTVLVLATFSSFYPAARAARLPVREALAHA